MFYSAKHFRHIIGEDESRLIAKTANQIIEAEGKVMYGNLYDSGELGGFSSGKHDKDTHVCIAIGIDEMGLFEAEPAVKVNTPENDKLVKATEQLNKAQAREIEYLRSKKSE